MTWWNIVKAEEREFDKPIQENPEKLVLDYRKTWGKMFGMVNRMVGEHDDMAWRDKANAKKHEKWSQDLKDYNIAVKTMIKDMEKEYNVDPDIKAIPD